MTKPLRVGIIGAGANTKSKHIPGLRAIPDVEIVAVCNRRAESTAAVAKEFGIPRTFETWQSLASDPDIDAVVIGAWPYLHCPIVLAALEAGKHVLTEARMSMDAAEARQMLAAANDHPDQVAQIVPSPFGLKGHAVMLDLLGAGYVGEIREVYVMGMNNGLGDRTTPLTWRQDATFSGLNMLTLGIVHETVCRWTPPPVRVMAQVHAFIPSRIDPESGVRRAVGTPDSVQVLTALANGGRALYQFSGVTPLGDGLAVRIYGSEGVLHYDFLNDKIFGLNQKDAVTGAKELREITIPADQAAGWRVESEFVDSIRTGAPVQFTDFVTGVAYMEFTEAVARSARTGVAVPLPLEPPES